MKVAVEFELDTTKNTMRMSGHLDDPTERTSLAVTNPGAVQMARALLGQLIEFMKTNGRAEKVQGNGSHAPTQGLILPNDPDNGDDVPGKPD